MMIGALAGALSFTAVAADWPQFRGPNHDGSSPEHILTVWPAAGLKQIWKRPMADGFSGITVADGRAFTLETRETNGGPQETCVAMDANTGRELWAAPLGGFKYDEGGDKGTPDNDGGDGPRSTPACDGGKVYAYTSGMKLSCMDAATGRQVWACDMIREHAGRNIPWQCAASPMIDGDLLFVAGGGTGQALLAFDKNDGRVVWKGQDDLMTQSTPVAATILGVRQVIFLTQKGLVSVAPATGAVLWRFPFRFKVSTAISPVVCGDIVYASAAYGVGTSACKISKTEHGLAAARLWSQPAGVLANHWSTPVYSEGYIYGISGQGKFGSAPLVCVNAATGKVLWSHDGFGPGGCALADGCVLVLSDAGDLALVKATPAGYNEIARCHALAGKCWNSPSISQGRIYARSTREGACLDVSVK